MIAMLAAGAVFCLVLAIRPRRLSAMVGTYLATNAPAARAARSRTAPPPGLLVGGAIGAMLLPGGPVLGAAVGVGVGHAVGAGIASSALRRRARRLGQELPTVADMCALYVLSGESVTGAIRRFVRDANGIAVNELTEILGRVDSGAGFPEAAREVARASIHRDAGRLYELLAQAHRSGARLVDSLEMYAADRRAAIEREMTAEGGRRALTGYGPILGLMIPTTLLFLMYPTLAGLDALSNTR